MLKTMRMLNYLLFSCTCDNHIKEVKGKVVPAEEILLYIYFLLSYIIIGSLDNVVSIVTGYGLDD
jgi:hypothetical protein